MANMPVEPITNLEHDPQAARLQADYLDRLRRLLKRAPTDIREDALREVQSHIEDEWHALGGGLPALHSVLERLGPPEAYGRDLALQLMLLNGDRRPALGRLALAAVFWASTSLIGMLMMILAVLLSAFALGMLLTAETRAFGIPMRLIDATDLQFGSYHTGQFYFPPASWSPVLIALVGLVPVIIIFAVLYRFLGLWLRSRLAQRGLWLVSTGPAPAVTPGWERTALASMLAFAITGIAGCLLFSILSGIAPVGTPADVRLPDDLFRTPLTALAFVCGLLFLISPVLGLWWAARRGKAGRK